MSDRPDKKRTGPEGQNAAKPHPAGDEPGFVDGIPVEELVRMTREFTARITNEDRQRLALELNESGHQRSIQSSAPFLLQQFFTGKIDLDVELARRYPSPPLLSEMTFTPDPGKVARHGFALFSGQDSAASISLEVHGASGALDISFLLQSMIAVRFSLGSVTETTRAKFLQLMRRQNGIAFLWTCERWERDYLIFVVRDQFARMYAFGPERFDGACRLTPDVVINMVTWLEALWSSSDGGSVPQPEELPPDAISW